MQGLTQQQVLGETRSPGEPEVEGFQRSLGRSGGVLAGEGGWQGQESLGPGAWGLGEPLRGG